MPKYKMNTIALVPVEAIIESPDLSNPEEYARAQQLARLVAMALYPTAEGATQAGIELAPADANLSVRLCEFCQKSSPKISWGPGWMKCPGCGKQPRSAAEWQLAEEIECTCPPSTSTTFTSPSQKALRLHVESCLWLIEFTKRLPPGSSAGKTVLLIALPQGPGCTCGCHGPYVVGGLPIMHLPSQCACVALSETNIARAANLWTAQGGQSPEELAWAIDILEREGARRRAEEVALTKLVEASQPTGTMEATSGEHCPLHPEALVFRNRCTKCFVYVAGSQELPAGDPGPASMLHVELPMSPAVVAEHLATNRASRPGDERTCSMCSKPWHVRDWNFYDLCYDCFREFDWQKMAGRSPPPPGVKYELGVNYFEDSRQWISFKRAGGVTPAMPDFANLKLRS